MFLDPHVVISAGVAAFEHRNTIRLAAKKFWLRVTRGRFPVLVFGPGGVGKTTLGHFLAAPTDRLLSMAKYERSIETEEFHLSGAIVASAYVPPGQEFRRQATWPQLFTMLAQSKRALIVNVVSHGYHVLIDLSVNHDNR